MFSGSDAINAASRTNHIHLRASDTDVAKKKMLSGTEAP